LTAKQLELIDLNHQLDDLRVGLEIASGGYLAQGDKTGESHEADVIDRFFSIALVAARWRSVTCGFLLVVSRTPKMEVDLKGRIVRRKSKRP